MNISRLERLPSYRELQAKKAAEELAQRNRQGLALPFEIAWFNGEHEIEVDPVPKHAEAPTEQPKFRKGDRLVCVESWSNWLTAGKVYEVRFEPQSDAVYITDDDGDTVLCHVSRFRLATAEEAKSIEQPKFRKGDRLVCVDAKDGTQLTEGETYVVVAATRCYVRVADGTGGYVWYRACRFQLAPAN
jgi:hypothetical protein